MALASSAEEHGELLEVLLSGHVEKTGALVEAHINHIVKEWDSTDIGAEHAGETT